MRTITSDTFVHVQPETGYQDDSLCRLSEAFPDFDERAEIIEALTYGCGGPIFIGGGAEPLVRILVANIIEEAR